MTWEKEVCGGRDWCEVCGKTLVTLDPHHYIHKSQCSGLRENIRNGVCVCRNCHTKAHQDTKWFSDWMQKNRPADKQTCDEILKQSRKIK